MNKDEVSKYLSYGSDITGGLIGSAIGIAGGPVGVLIGGGVGVAISCGLKEVIGRGLSEREVVRTAASAEYIISGVKKRLDEGAVVRNDNFFDNSRNRSSAEELFEGILFKCKDQYQEKKIAFISKLFEKTIFDESISPESANQILSSADNFTYRKLCILSFFGQLDSNQRKNDLMQDCYSWYPDAELGLELEILLQDIFEMWSLGLLDSGNMLYMNRTNVMPGKLSLTSIGAKLFEILGLEEIENDDLSRIFNLLLYKDEYGKSEHGTINGQKI